LDELQELIDNPDETDDLLRLDPHRLPIREFRRCAASPPSWPATMGHRTRTWASTSSSPDITLPLHAGRARSREPSTPVSWPASGRRTCAPLPA